MIPTLPQVKEIFVRYNASIFKDLLPEPRFRITAARGYLGKMAWRIARDASGRPCYHSFEMRISNRDVDFADLVDTVVHEMIHLHILLSGVSDTSPHGPVFRRLMKAINQSHGLNISISRKVGADGGRHGAPAGAMYVVCRLEMSDGATGFMLAARSRIFSLWDTVASHRQVARASWWISGNPAFADYRRSLQFKRFYPVGADALDRMLADAAELERRGDRIGPKGGF